MRLLFALFLHGVENANEKKICILCLGHILLMINALHCGDQKAGLCCRSGASEPFCVWRAVGVRSVSETSVQVGPGFCLSGQPG